MVAEEERVRSLETDIAIMKRDVSQFNLLFAKLDITIEKLGDVSNNISKLLAVHEERIDVLQSIDREMEKKIEVKSKEIRELYSKVESMNTYLVGELASTESKIRDELKTIRTMIESEQVKQTHTLNKISDKVQSIEKWKWTIIGFSVATGWLIDKIPMIFELTK